MTSLRIFYESEDFPPGMSPMLDGQHYLEFTWDDILWAAVTVGRPNRQYVFRHGLASIYEALFRWSLVKMSLEQSYGRRLKRTAAAKTLDPTEKGAVNYFLGLVISKLFAEKLLDTPWVLHLDVFRPQLDVQLAGRSRPDLIGLSTQGDWVAFECKGRISPPSAQTKRRAKQQAQRVITIDGTRPRLQIGGVSFFRNDLLQFYWRDPEPEENRRGAIVLETTPEIWANYYNPVLALVRSDPMFVEMRETQTFVYLENADIKISIEPEVLRHIDEGRWEKAREVVQKGADSDSIYHRDGIAVIAGPSWRERRLEFDHQT